MDEEDLEPRPPKGLQPRVLDPLSIDELTGYIAELKAEIARVEAEIESKRNVRDSAEGIFRH